LYKSLSEDGGPCLTTLLGVARALGVTLTAHITVDGRTAYMGVALPAHKIPRTELLRLPQTIDLLDAS
jgi:hypothetical protein